MKRISVKKPAGLVRAGKMFQRAGIRYLQKGNIRQQLYKVYVLAGLIPITLIGIFLLVNTLS